MTTIPTQEQYEANEAAQYRRQIHAIESAPLAERQEARQEFTAAMRESPEIVGERVAWLIEGCYGKGAYDVAQRIIAQPRMNRVAALGQMIAALEWHCPPVFAAQAWKSLAAAERKAIDAAIEVAIGGAA